MSTLVVRRVKIPKIVLDKNAKDADSAPAMIIWRNRAVLSRLRDDAGGRESFAESVINVSCRYDDENPDGLHGQ